MASKIIVNADELVTTGSLGRTFSMTDQVGASEEVTWETASSVAVELEVRIQVLELNGLSPRVFNHLRWQIWSIGHGGVAYDEQPVTPTGTAPGVSTQNRQPQWPVPARGVVVRLSARRVRVQLAINVAAGRPLVAVSFQPVSSVTDWRPYPSTDLGPFDGIYSRAFFPAHANEWRLSRHMLMGDVPSSMPIRLFSWSNDAAPPLEAVVTAGRLWDWVPIPLGAHSWYPFVNGVAQADPRGLTALYR